MKKKWTKVPKRIKLSFFKSSKPLNYPQTNVWKHANKKMKITVAFSFCTFHNTLIALISFFFLFFSFAALSEFIKANHAGVKSRYSQMKQITLSIINQSKRGLMFARAINFFLQQWLICCHNNTAFFVVTTLEDLLLLIARCFSSRVQIRSTYLLNSLYD